MPVALMLAVRILRVSGMFKVAMAAGLSLHSGVFVRDNGKSMHV
jgi:hypothetical protein